MGHLVQAAGGRHVSVPFAETGRQEVAAWELGMLLEGIDPRQVRRRKRYHLPAAATGAEDSANRRDLRLAALGPMHPGSLGEQYNVCGTPGCRCKDPQNPRKHGPYYQLSYSWRGKSSSRFVRPGRVAAMRRKVANYKRFRELVNEWVDLALELERAERVPARPSDGD